MLLAVNEYFNEMEALSKFHSVPLAGELHFADLYLIFGQILRVFHKQY